MIEMVQQMNETSSHPTCKEMKEIHFFPCLGLCTLAHWDDPAHLKQPLVLRRAHFDNSQNASHEATNGFENDTLQIEDSGFPVVPRPISWTKVK